MTPAAMDKKRPKALGSDLSEVSARRSLLMLTGGAVLGLMIAGYSLFTARGTSTLYVPPEDVAIVNQQPISRIDYLIQLQALFGVDLAHATAEQRNKVLHDMIREELFVQRGKELDVSLNDPEVRSSMVNAVELEIAANVITSQPNDAQLQSFYQTHAVNYASEGIMRLYDYASVKPSAEAVRAAQRVISQGTPSPEVLARIGFQAARNVATDEYYFAAKIHLGERLFEAARDLTDGQISTPVVTASGVHLLYMVTNSKPVQQSFAAARDHVLNDFRKDAIARVRSGEEDYLRKRANVLIADDMH